MTKKDLSNFSYIIISGLIVSSVIFLTQKVNILATFTPSVDESSIIEIIDRTLPSVVNIIGVQKDANQNSTVVSRGTGFITSKDGLILTNKHVVSQSGLTYNVILPDGRKYTPKKIARDPLFDLAVLQIDGRDFKSLPLGNSDSIKIGQTAIAVGNSLGIYSNSVTRGIISALGRSLSASDNLSGRTENLDDAIQTDAAINHGNSGGPLINSRGEAIGINTAIVEGAEGLGFAIPINEAKKAVELFVKDGIITRPYLGVRYISINTEIQTEEKLTYDYGALVFAGYDSPNPAVVVGGPSDKAGVKERDIILSINGVLVRGKNSLKKIIQNFKPGDTIKMVISRSSGVTTLNVTLEAVPQE